MVPGCVAGLYTPEQTQLHLPPLAAYARLDAFVHDRVVDIDFDRKLIYLQGQQQQRDAPAPISFDVVSLDIGSTSRGYLSCPGASEYAIPTRPIDQLIRRLEEALHEAKQQQQQQQAVRLVVIGGGVAGVELALSVTSRWRKELPAATTTTVECTILDRGDQLLPGAENDQARAVLQSVLDEKQITVQHGSVVTSLTDTAVQLQSGSELPYTHCLWATGAGSHALARKLQAQRGLDGDQHGWIRVTPTLQSTSHPFVFAAGDCATITGLTTKNNEDGDAQPKSSPPKAGVYAVRAGPVLIENLTRYLESSRREDDEENSNDDEDEEPASSSPTPPNLIDYKPQDDFLKLLACGDGTALGFRFGLAMRGKWVFELKDNIDQSFMKLFDVSHLPSKPNEQETAHHHPTTRGSTMPTMIRS